MIPMIVQIMTRAVQVLFVRSANVARGSRHNQILTTGVAIQSRPLIWADPHSRALVWQFMLLQMRLAAGISVADAGSYERPNQLRTPNVRRPLHGPFKASGQQVDEVCPD
jgi:hypothetical protein